MSLLFKLAIYLCISSHPILSFYTFKHQEITYYNNYNNHNYNNHNYNYNNQTCLLNQTLYYDDNGVYKINKNTETF